jgi:hypothetical protein
MIPTPRTFNRTSLQDIRDTALTMFRSLEDDPETDILFRDACFALAQSCNLMDALLARINQKD